MPTYEYRCTKCSHEFEAIQPITSDPLTDCPECDGVVERLISSGGGLLFKGSGFYITDYRSDNYKASAKSESDSSSSSSGDNGGKSGSSGGKSGSSDGKSGSSDGKSGSSDGKSGSSDGGNSSQSTSKSTSSSTTSKE